MANKKSPNYDRKVNIHRSRSKSKHSKTEIKKSTIQENNNKVNIPRPQSKSKHPQTTTKNSAFINNIQKVNIPRTLSMSTFRVYDQQKTKIKMSTFPGCIQKSNILLQ